MLNIGDERALSWYFIRQNILNVRELRLFSRIVHVLLRSLRYQPQNILDKNFELHRTNSTRNGLVLRLDNELWTNIVRQSGLFYAQGRSIPLEWVLVSLYWHRW